MSWSVSGIGKPQAVKAAIEKQANYSCAEPEETVRKAALAVVYAVLDAQPVASAVQVSASGHQSSVDADGKAQNQLSIDVKCIYGFAE